MNLIIRFTLTAFFSCVQIHSAVAEKPAVSTFGDHQTKAEAEALGSDSFCRQVDDEEADEQIELFGTCDQDNDCYDDCIENGGSIPYCHRKCGGSQSH